MNLLDRWVIRIYFDCLRLPFEGDWKVIAVQSLMLSFLLLVPSPGPEVIKLFSCSTQLSMIFFLVINLKVLTIAMFVLLNIAEHEQFSSDKYENANCCSHFHIY